MFLKQIDLTTALRPSYLPDEVLLFVQDNVGLYEGKNKLPNHQNGHVYLTSHRICFVEDSDPRTYSVGLDLKHVERYEYYAGFWKSSPKITLIPKPAKRGSLQSRAVAGAAASTSSLLPDAAPSRSTAASPAPYSSSASSPAPSSLSAAASTPAPPPKPSAATWVCTICSFPNPVPSNFDPTLANAHTPLPPCLTCGIKPALAHVLKAAIASASSRPPVPDSPFAPPPPSTPQPVTGSLPLRAPPVPPVPDQLNGPSHDTTSQPPGDPGSHCPRCTFLNHPSLLSCEMCGASLPSHEPQPTPKPFDASRHDSPGPTLNVGGVAGSENPDSLKISFRTGGDKQFYEKLKGSMTQRKWLLQEAPPVPGSRRTDEIRGNDSPRQRAGSGRAKTAGIAGLEQMGMDRRKNNELTIGNAFEDLEALMASAKEVQALADSFARQINNGADGPSSEANALLAESASQMGLITTKDIVGGGSSSGAESLYLSELARNLAEFLTDDARGVLKKAGGIVSLVDLWAMFNRVRGGVELVSPNDLEKAARLWEKLKLPVRLRRFKSGVLVVQGSDRTDETTVRALLDWLNALRSTPPPAVDVAWDWASCGRGVTPQDAAERFGWSLGVAEEELEMAEERGAVCREDAGLEGVRFWLNLIVDQGDSSRRQRQPRPLTDDEKIARNLTRSGLPSGWSREQERRVKTIYFDGEYRPVIYE